LFKKKAVERKKEKDEFKKKEDKIPKKRREEMMIFSYWFPLLLPHSMSQFRNST